MLLSFIRNLLRRRAGGNAARAPAGAPLRLHIGGKVRHPDWTIVDVLPGPLVDYVGSCTNLSRFGDASVADIYASHVIEHLGYRLELAAALHEFHRVLAPGGTLRASVPDLSVLCALFIDPALNAEEHFQVMRMMYGGQADDADFHYVGLNEELLASCLLQAGFAEIVRVDNFMLFDDASSLIFKGRPISLNLRASKPPAT